jgi:predicted RNase H-like nuclease (RuvC/YqgF family)
MQQSKKSVTARIPQELYDKCNQYYENMTDAVIAGLELLCNTNCNTDVIAIGESKAQIEERDTKIKELQEFNDSLIKEIKNYKEPKNILELQNTRFQDLQEQTKVKDQLQEARIADLKEQIQTLNEQIKKKDSQIDDSNKNVFAQANSLYNLTKENKLLPGEKKSFWKSLKFWK